MAPVKRLGSLPGTPPEPLIPRGVLNQFKNPIGQRLGSLLLCNQAGLIVEGRFNESSNRVNHTRGTPGIGFDDVESPTFADRGMKQEMRLFENGVFLGFVEQAGESQMVVEPKLLGELTELAFDITATDHPQVGFDPAIEEHSESADAVIDTFVGCQPGDDGEPEWLLQRFRIQFRQGLRVDTVAEDTDLAHAVPA